jgi:hypothetical protein
VAGGRGIGAHAHLRRGLPPTPHLLPREAHRQIPGAPVNRGIGYRTGGSGIRTVGPCLEREVSPRLRLKALMMMTHWILSAGA